MDLPRDAEIAVARRLLPVVGVAFLLVQLLVFALDRPPGWDEAIYLSQVTPGAEPLPFVPSRARGVTFLALPVLQLGGSLPVLRVCLALASAGALIGAFSLWAPVIGVGAVAAGALFAFAWPALFYGSELMPNLWMAFVAVAVCAVLARRLARGEGSSDELIAGGLVALAAFFRPLDAVVLTAALVLVPIAMRRGTIVWTAHLLLGLAAGLAPWLVEMTVRFGSPGEALSAAARLGHTGRWSLVENVRQYLALSDGPPIGPVADPDLPLVGLLWFLGLVTLAAVGVRVSSSRGTLAPVAVPTIAGLVLAAEYVVFTDAQAPRFLLPALALLVLPAGVGLAAVLAPTRRGAGPARTAAAVATATLVAAWAVVQVGIAARVETGVSGQRATAERAGLRVRALAARQPCVVYSEPGFPMVGYAARCRAVPIGEADAIRHPERSVPDGVRVFVVLRRTEAPSPPAGGVLLAEIATRSQLTWFVYGLG
ncbi:MAG: hypothetical protein ACRDG8_04895 [Actinomycetota bacterium]